MHSNLDWLIDNQLLYVQQQHLRIFPSYRDVTIAGEGLQNLVLCSELKTFLYRATPAVTLDLFFRSHPKGRPI
jgi:hypothetical protein